MGHSVVRTESGQNHFHSSEISPKRGTTFSRRRQFTSNKINELIHVRQRIVLKMGLDAHPPDQRAQLRLDWWPPSPSTRFPTPVAAKAGPMPAGASRAG